MSPTTESKEAGLGAGAASGDAAAECRGEEKGDDRLWRSVVIGEQEHRIDMKCIQPYKKVISHGGMETQMVGISFPCKTCLFCSFYCLTIFQNRLSKTSPFVL